MLRRDKGGVLLQVLEVRLLSHGRFADVIVRGYSMLVGDLGKFTHVLHVVTADVDVEKDHVAIPVLLLEQVIKIRSYGNQRLGKARLDIDGVDRQIDNGHTG